MKKSLCFGRSKKGKKEEGGLISLRGSCLQAADLPADTAVTEAAR